MGSESHNEAQASEREQDDLQDREPRSGEGAASALATMKKQLKQLRRESGAASEDATHGGPA